MRRVALRLGVKSFRERRFGSNAIISIRHLLSYDLPHLMRRIVASLVLIAFAFASPTMHSAEAGSDFFESKIRPLLVERCYECHSETFKKIKGGLKLDSPEATLKGGDSGPAIVPGNPDKSLLIKAVRYSDENLQMPPKHQLAASEIAALEQWVKMGAPDPRTNRAAKTSPAAARIHWAFQPLSNPVIPKVNNARWPNTSIDRFILAQLESRSMTPNFAAEKLTLLRRAAFDLIGLPPSPEQIADFLNDPSPGAFERVVDRLLASPQYGERWGRYWLDLARYADTAGDNADYPIPQAYKYRNYVIESFEHDKPYDEFIREQMAGDLLPASSPQEKRDKIIATGYLALARRFGTSPQAVHHLTIEDAIDTMGRSVLGLSLSCARCHDHKYDPIPTEDYYGLYGIFSSTRFPFAGAEDKKRPTDLVPLIPAAELDAIIKPFQTELAAVDKELQKLQDQADLLRRERMSTEEVRKNIDEVRRKRQQLIDRAPIVDLAFAVADTKGTNAHVQRRGEPSTLGAEVPRHFLSALGGQILPKNEIGSGRLELAAWLTTNPLAARVMVNRIWQHHFGKGLVQTPSDFGTRGRPPTHPELLDHLAQRFIRSGWSVKAMHRLIMLSRTYQQASIDNPEYLRLDPANDLLWKFNRQRLDAEAIRDSMLLVSGQLDLRPGGAHPFPSEHNWDFTQHSQFTALYETTHRSVYLMQQRIKKHPFLATFDGADANSSTAERMPSTTPLQALFMMNDPFVHAQAAQFAARLCEAGCDTDRINRAHLMIFGRPPRPEEVRQALDYLERHRKTSEKEDEGWRSLVRGLFASNEFLYID
jgi:hypothetical protein